MDVVNIIVTVCKPDGTWHIVEVGWSDRLTIYGDGAILFRPEVELVSGSVDTDVETHLRLLAHPFTGLQLSDRDREVLLLAASMIEAGR
jgi:hypothetical protein